MRGVGFLHKAKLSIFENLLVRSLTKITSRSIAGNIRIWYPRIVIVKQDVNEDLYCCPPGTPAQEIVRSTLLRPGPVAFFTRFNAEFLLLETEPDPECNIWKQKWTENRWWPLERFEAYQKNVPGRDYGQSDFAVKAERVDWNKFDIVISIDVSVPERITRQFPGVVWCYYVREVKTSAYSESVRTPIKGQDLHLNHQFRPFPGKRTPHNVEFPYHFHYHGCFNDLFGIASVEKPRGGVFLEHHSAVDLSSQDIEKLKEFGPVNSTYRKVSDPDDDRNDRRVVTTMEPDVLNELMTSKYYVKVGGRNILGTAFVEAVAAGCLVLGNPIAIISNFLFSKNTSFSKFDELLKKLRLLEFDDRLYNREVNRQRRLVDYLCYYKPANELLRKSTWVIRRRNRM